jgi:hypothetical protein
MDAAVAAAVPQLRDSAGREVTLAVTSKAKTALVLASIAIAFFVGTVIRHWIW